jgi:hypothetical protein
MLKNIASLKKQLIHARFKHLAFMYLIAVTLYLYSTFPHKWWIFVTITMISAVIEPGLIIKRSILRSQGSLMVLILMIPLLYLLQLNYRLVPVTMICAAVCMIVSFSNPRRYDISIFFITMVVFLFLAQTIPPEAPQAPIEMVLNRAICTAIGIFIVIACDYFLFNAYHYSRKLYFMNQLSVVELLKNAVKNIERASINQENTAIFIEKLRDEFNETYLNLETSCESLQADLKIQSEQYEKIEQFRSICWKLRQIIFALTFSQLILKSEEKTQKHLEQFKTLIAEAKSLITHSDNQAE